MCEVGGFVCVVKNRFVKIVLEGKFCVSIVDYLMGMIVFVFFEDFVVVVKVVDKYVKGNDKFVILGGVMGDMVFDFVGVKVVV